jgi:hypothetical protein
MSTSIKQKTYTVASKSEISGRIGKIKSKKHYIELFRIIHEHGASYTRVAGKGVYVDLERYDDNLLSEIERFLNTEYPRTIIKPISEGMNTYYSEDSDMQSLKLTNRERISLRRTAETSDGASASDKKHSNRMPIIKQLA